MRLPLPPSRLAPLAGVSLTLALMATWFLLLRPVTFGGPAGYIIVSGHSMEPTLLTGDLAVTQRQPSYAVGDIVAFETEGGVVIHRIVGGDAVTGYQVKGDNKERPDLWRPRPEIIVGKVWFWVPQMGSALAFVRQPAIFAGLAAAFTFFIAYTTGPIWPGRRRQASSAAAAAPSATARSGPSS